MSTEIGCPRPVARGARAALAGGICVIAALALWGASASASFSPRCFITGGGTVDGDRFSGQAASYPNKVLEGDQGVDGVWRHTTADGRTLRGEIDSLFCRRNGGDPGRPSVDFSIADFSGTGTFDGQEVTFAGRGQDHGEPGHADRYHIAIEGSDGTVIYATGGILDSGNFQIHPTNPGHP